jgi:acyl dehydratase
VVQDIALGQRAAREREEVVSEERVEIEEHHPAPVLVDSRLRAHLVLRGYKPMDGGAELVLEVTVERESQAKPVCVAESVTRRYVQPPAALG